MTVQPTYKTKDIKVPANPADLSYPSTFPVEIAMRVASVKDICAAYNFTQDEWRTFAADDNFRRDLAAATEMLREEGMSFKVKARLQSEELLKTSWNMIHEGTVPPAVRADLLKFTVRAAGLDGSKDQAKQAEAHAPLQIQINLG